jgi:glycosyltransferase involved in cell wall biosynthesis
MSPPPRLSIGLPVYNGERYLAGSIEALLGQSYEDFELIISDNASTDDTPGICHRYEKQDSRIRYIRQSRNIGLVPNHNFVVRQARGELFKWASYDDLYARDLVKRCVEALDEHPQVVLAHSWSAHIDSSGNATKLLKFPVATASSRAPERFRSMLFDAKGDYTYAVMRIDVLRRTPLHASYHRAEYALITEFALHGSFYQVEDWLFFRRERPDEPQMSVRDRCAIFDPRRADALRNPAIRLYSEYIWGYLAAIRRAPLSPADRRECHLWLAQWLATRAIPAREPLGQPVSSGRQPVVYLVRLLASLALPGRDVRVGEQPPAERPDLRIHALVPGRGERTLDQA